MEKIKLKLNKLAKEFNLNYDDNDRFKYLICSKREIIIRNFLGICPMQSYSKYHKNNPELIEPIICFLESENYKNELENPQACILSRQNIIWESKIIEKVDDEKLIKEVQNFYKKLKKAIGKSNRLTIIWKPKKSEK